MRFPRPRLHALSIVTALISISFITVSSSYSNNNEHISRTEAEFTSSEASDSIARFAVSKATGDIYVSGDKNVVYKLDSDLREKARAVTGPSLDSHLCDFDGCSNDNHTRGRTLTDNWNKVLVVDDENGKVITCGSLFQVGLIVQIKHGLIDHGCSIWMKIGSSF